MHNGKIKYSRESFGGLAVFLIAMAWIDRKYWPNPWIEGGEQVLLVLGWGWVPPRKRDSFVERWWAGPSAYRVLKSRNGVGQMAVQVFISLWDVHFVVCQPPKREWNPRGLAISKQHRDESLDGLVFGVTGVVDALHFPQHTSSLARFLPTLHLAADKFPCRRGGRNPHSGKGTWGIFKQGIGQETPEAVVTGPQNAILLRLSADGAWVLYLDGPKAIWETGFLSLPGRLLRIPVSRGVPQLVLETKAEHSFDCARAPASLCVILEPSQDEKHFTVTAFDPLKGRGKTLRTIEKDPSAKSFGSALSPDGSTFALSMGGEPEIHIRLLSLSGGADREITVKSWPNLAWNGPYWSSDGKGLYCGCRSSQGGAILYVDLKGNARVLWQFKGSLGPSCAIPSPDGHYLAMGSQPVNGNIWMLKGF
jgi:hypothetical protein